MYKENEKHPYHSHIQTSAQKSETNVRLEALKLQEKCVGKTCQNILTGKWFYMPPKNTQQYQKLEKYQIKNVCMPKEVADQGVCMEDRNYP